MKIMQIQKVDTIMAFSGISLLFYMFCMPAYSAEILLKRIQPGGFNNPIIDLPGLSIETKIFGETSPIKDFTKLPLIKGDLEQDMAAITAITRFSLKLEKSNGLHYFLGLGSN